MSDFSPGFDPEPGILFICRLSSLQLLHLVFAVDAAVIKYCKSWAD